MNLHSQPSHPVFPYSWASDWGEDRYGLWQAFIYQAVRHIFRWIEPGSFMMGSPETEQGRYSDEDLHQVTISQGFWLAETTVTQALWQAVMGDNPSHFKGAECPVEQVSWADAQAFIAKLRQLYPDLNARLPWEAEWEYACRAGTQTPFNFAGELTLAKVNYRGTWEYKSDEWGKGAKQATAEVKAYPCNAWGLFAMHGNVWEWCEDVWRDSLGTAAVCDPWQVPTGLEPDALRVVRGGSWDYDGGNVRCAIRERIWPDGRYDRLGLRLALGHAELQQGGGTAG
ncbi:formylglycine-generating enzyme family protein [Methylovulum psychrotolerans]|uniref:Serine/threonine-protein kinase pkn1 n=1 Tax=Methylovulum psychrotolerans TaxID=1704499 RepID=A0A2S5CPT3_9GAMM|nr:formylglycine-generating enzyme family protein [Methylovulum psychrotolerans]POZ52821.1 Serine/threonine-protein kinase pkn1 [Methylovulum psychrotolerans]